MAEDTAGEGAKARGVADRHRAGRSVQSEVGEHDDDRYPIAPSSLRRFGQGIRLEHNFIIFSSRLTCDLICYNVSDHDQPR